MNASYTKILIEYLSWLDTLGYSDDVIDCGKVSVRLFFEWLENNQIQSINLLTNKHITEYYTYLETRPNKVFKGKLLSVAHLNKNYFSIDKLCEFLHNYELKNAPVPTNKRLKMDTQAERILKIEVFTQEEIKILYNCISKIHPRRPFQERQMQQYETKLIFTLCYGCGLRKSEAFNLQMQNVDFDKKTVFVKQGKNYKDRIVPMSTSVYRDLQDYIYNFRHKLKLNHNRLLFSTDQMVRLRLKHLQSVCDNENIKAKRITTHILRHSIATHLLQNGMNIENIALFLGHSSLDSTQIYTHIVNQS